MVSNRFALFAGSLLAISALAACNDNDENFPVAPGTFAIVRFVNVTDANIDAIRDGGIEDGNLAFGIASRCFAVDAGTPNLTFVVTANGTVINGFTPNFVPGGSYLVIASTGAAGATVFRTVRTDVFVGTGGNARVAAVNAINGTQNYDLYVTAPGAALGTATASNLAFGVPSNPFLVGAGPEQLRWTNAGSTAVILDAGNTVFVARRNYVAVLGPAATAGAALRSLVVPAC